MCGTPHTASFFDSRPQPQTRHQQVPPLGPAIPCSAPHRSGTALPVQHSLASPEQPCLPCTTLAPAFNSPPLPPVLTLQLLPKLSSVLTRSRSQNRHFRETTSADMVELPKRYHLVLKDHGDYFLKCRPCLLIEGAACAAPVRLHARKSPPEGGPLGVGRRERGKPPPSVTS